MKCIAVLTRGYSNIDGYSLLIKRNQCISTHLDDKTVDILIFHEGNIPEEHQLHIQSKTPELFLQFINVSGIAFKPEKEFILKETFDWFSLGYRHMCSFWFVDFWHFVEKYDALLRIDEDCQVDFNIDRLLNDESSHLFIAGGTIEDCDFVTIGLNQFSINFINNNNDYDFKRSNSRLPVGPYTNLMLFKLNKIRENIMFKKYVDSIDKSEMIYKRRWGDLPLWGDVIYYIFGEDTMLIDNTIKYYHDSYKATIN